MKYAVVNTDGLVVNVVNWDGVTEFDAGDGVTLVDLPYQMATDDNGVEFRQYFAGPGWTYDGTNWIAPPPVEDEFMEAPVEEQ
jgi:hypothetical protein